MTRTIVDDCGNPVGERPMPEPTTPNSQQPSRGRQRGDSDYVLAQRAVEGYGYPLAFSAGEFWRFSLHEGWVPCSEHFKSHCNQIKRSNTAHTVFAIAATRLAVPTVEQQARPVLYWERVGGAWCEGWAPFEVQPHQILFTDSLVDILTGEAQLLDGRCIYGPRITLPWRVEDDSDEDTEFLHLVEHAFPDVELRRHFQEVMSLILLPHHQLRGQIILWGAPHTGKTTLATALACAPAGRLGMHTASEYSLVCSRWETAALTNKFCNLSDESPAVRGWPNFLKAYTSGVMRIEPKFGKVQSVTPTAKLISTSNEIQCLEDSSEAVAQRLYAFRFTRPIEMGRGGLGQTAHMTGGYWSDPKRRNSVLSWCYNGLERLHRRGCWDVPESAKAEIVTVMQQGDDTLATLKSVLKADDTGFVPTTLILSKLGPKMTGKRLGRYMATLYPGSENCRRRWNKEPVWGYSGVAWVE